MHNSLHLKQRKPVPHAFVLDAIAPLSPYTRPMFGCLAVYVKDKIVLILRDKATDTSDNGCGSPLPRNITIACAESSRTCDPLRY
jgi:hypothetical protein